YVDGCSQRMKGNFQEAMRLFTQCLQIQPENAAVHYELATVHKLLGANEQALQHARKCAAVSPDNEWYQLLLIDCLHSTGHHAQAIRTRENLVKKFPARGDLR